MQYKPMQKSFPWKRFWCPPEGKLELDMSGFLSDPEDEFWGHIKSDVVPFEEIHNTPCLILLGEPGIGKSNAIKTEKEALEQKIDSKNELILYKNLKDYNSEDSLRKDVFESGQWQKFKKGDFKLHFFLDSLDEVKIRIHNVTRIISKELKESPRECLFLRIACRTAEWPTSFRSELNSLWKENEVREYELAPLRLKDIRVASEISGINPDDFINAVKEKDAGSLASKPVTLNFLLNLFNKDGQFPESRFELYEKGCLLLCEEPDVERREKEAINKAYVGNLSTEQRFVVASRIAAALAFSSKVAVQRDFLHSETQQEGCIAVNELSGGKENVASGTFDITEYVVKEALTTGLFTSRGQNLFGFAHQTYQEFLAARYLKDTPFEQVKSLLFHPHDENRIVPQLYETTAWLAGQRQDVFSWTVKSEPEILLRSDVAVLNDIVKKELLAALLEKFKNEEIFDDWDFYKYYSKLNHPEISEQLKPFITDKNLSFIPRRAAIDIAEACNIKTLKEVLTDVALDHKEQYGIRTQAAHAVWKVGDNEVKERLERLAEGKAGDDPDDDLRGIGMRCVWPQKWSLLELLDNITSPQKDSLNGAYKFFLKYEAPPHITRKALADELPKALSIIKKWKNLEAYDGLWYLAEIYDEIFKSAWTMIPNQQIMEELSEIILFRTKEYQPICGARDKEIWKQLSGDTDKRHSIVKYIIEKNGIEGKEITSLASHETRLVEDSDFIWLLEETEKTDPGRHAFWADLIMWVLRDDFPADWISKFLEVRMRIPILQERYCTYWEFDSELARNGKANYLKRLRWEKRDAPKKPFPPVSTRIEETLKEIEEGHFDKWYDLAYYLSVDQETGEQQEVPSSVQETAGWKILDEPTRKLVIEAAKNFLLNYEPPEEDGFGRGSWSNIDISIHIAILLIYDTKSIVNEIPNHVWLKLIPYMVDYCLAFDRSELYCTLFNVAYEKAPDETGKYFSRLLQIKNEKDGKIYFIDYLKDCWPVGLNPLILEELNSPNIKPGSFEDLVEFLADKGVADVEGIVVEWLSSFNEGDDLSRKLFIKAVELTLTYWGDKHWFQVADVFHKYPGITKDVIGGLADTNRHIVKCLNNLSEPRLAELYCLISKSFPPETDSPREGFHIVGTREHIKDLRETILTCLLNKCSTEACTAIESLIDKLPNQKRWMRWKLNEAITNTLKKTWSPPTPPQIITMLQDRHRRYVESEEQLLTVVIESLERMQKFVKGELSPVDRFWNGNKPKKEERLSDEIAIWLKDDLSSAKGIIVNREVQPKRGQKTDIYVNAVKLSPEKDEAIQSLRIVIEVKGCWHAEVLSAMDSQLYERYMKENNMLCGLYVVGWYMCNQWSDQDSRKGKTPKMTIQELEKELERQATQLNERENDKNLKSFILELSL
ncbi:MAG: hypothetical protein C4526_02590 [Nitrospiraceae bacterium]|nr:MAG: hypothetical protein C4526_02590 [Nitrospiraceae bacterium]